MDRDKMLQTIDAAYAARQRGDKEGVAAFLAPEATYRLVGGASVPDLLSNKPQYARQAIDGLIDLFTFSNVERVGVVVDGDTAAIHMRITASVAGGAPVDSELLDLWRFDAEGKVAEMIQFADTAMVVSMLAAAAAG